MGIRKKLLSIGYTNEEIDKMVEQEYNSRVQLLPEKRNILDVFFDTKVGKFLSTDWIEYFANKLVFYEYNKLLKKEREMKEKEFIPPTLEKNTPLEVYEYYATHGIMPKETINHGNGHYTHIYEDGLTINVHTTLSGILTGEDIKKYEIFRKELLADYLNMPEEETIKMTNKEIQELVLKNEQSKKKAKRRILIPKK